MQDFLYIGVDLGAGSGRIFLAGMAPSELLLEEILRFQYPPVRSSGHLRWNLPDIFNAIKAGVRSAGARARQIGRPIHSVGVDSWAVDYGLLDSQQQLVELPICYRDERTNGVMEEVFARLSREEIFNRTGIQFLSLNTLFQLYAHTNAGLPASARRLLLVPDLIHCFLTGKAVTEYTNATTTQLVSSVSGNWDRDLMAALQLPSELFIDIVPAGTQLGPVKPELLAELNLENLRVVAPATHDTGSAIAGTPLGEGWAYISSGTWSLVGVERDSVLINSQAARHNFTNEGGAFGTIRFLKNVMGLWILEACRKEWKQVGLNVDYQRLLHKASMQPDCLGLVFPDDERFFNPPSMLSALAMQLTETGQSMPDDPSAVAKVILDSLAFRYASVLRTIEKLTRNKIEGVQIVGGGSQNDYLNQMTANATGLPTVAGPVEATVLGNISIQAITAGRFVSLTQARGHIRRNLGLKTFSPQGSRTLEDAWRRYQSIEGRYLGT